MFGIGPGELIIILALAFIVVGPEKLPEMGRTVGRIMSEFRTHTDVLRSSLTMDGTPSTSVLTGFPAPSGTHPFGGFAGNLAAMQMAVENAPDVAAAVAVAPQAEAQAEQVSLPRLEAIDPRQTSYGARRRRAEANKRIIDRRSL